MLPRTVLIEVALIEIAKSLARLRVEFAVQRIGLTRLRREMRTTNRSDIVVRIDDILAALLSILCIDMDQPRRRIDEVTIITKTIG